MVFYHHINSCINFQKEVLYTRAGTHDSVGEKKSEYSKLKDHGLRKTY